MPTITKVTRYILSLPLHEPFGVAARTATYAPNVTVVLTSSDGLTGIGCCTPVEYVTGENVTTVGAALDQIAESILGLQADALISVSEYVRSALEPQPTARAAIEMAYLDLWAKSLVLPLWRFYGSTATSLESDLTIPLVEPESAKQKAKTAAEQGFKALKIKVGDPAGIDSDMRRLEAVVVGAPDCKLRIDANQAFDAVSASVFIKDVIRIAPNCELIEQPVPKNDIDALSRVHEATKPLGLLLFADESAQTARSVFELLKRNAVDGINVKVMKSGLFGAYTIAEMVKEAGAKLMIGCMLEPALSLSASCALACGWYGGGGFDYIDIDSHHLLAPNDVFIGGLTWDGPILTPEMQKPGWGVELNPESELLAAADTKTWEAG